MNLSLTHIVIKMNDNLEGLLSLKIHVNASANILSHKTKKNEIRTEIVKKCIENELRIPNHKLAEKVGQKG